MHSRGAENHHLGHIMSVCKSEGLGIIATVDERPGNSGSERETLELRLCIHGGAFFIRSAWP